MTSSLQFDNRFTRELPADAVADNYRRTVTDAYYSRVMPTPVRAPQLLGYALPLAEQLGIPESVLTSPNFVAVMAGNGLVEGMEPHASAYGGHQFGHWAGQLGDGRAINLGELITPNGERQMLQLKGAGPTPYSRSADGRAVLRSSVREFVCSEAMYGLGVATTRALTLVGTGDAVLRDMFYDGRAADEPGAIVCRVAPSFLRFGHYELPASRQDIPLLRQLVEFTIRHHFSHLIPVTGVIDAPVIVAFYQAVVEATAKTISEWMRVGFVHGVMNTDNLSILGLTIDYGPYGWLEVFDEDWTPNTTDSREHRYAYGRQPRIGLWNLAQLGNALYPLVDDVAALQSSLDAYVARYTELERDVYRKKLGLVGVKESDDLLFSRLRGCLQQGAYDFTLFFRSLAEIDFTSASFAPEHALARLQPAQYTRFTEAGHEPSMREWLKNYAERVGEDVVISGVTHEQRCAQMKSVNPKYIFRNYMAQQVTEKLIEGDTSLLNDMLRMLANPYDEQPEFERYFALRPEWADQKAGCSMLSCSS